MLLKLMTLLPKFLVRPVARNYIAGETVEECIARGRDLNAQGWELAIDLLGEHSSQSQAESTIDQYRRLLDAGTAAGLAFGLSMKLSHLGADVSEDCAAANLEQILKHARQNKIHVTIDMESSKTTDATYRTYERFLGDHDLGCVVQAYLRRSQTDVQTILDNHDPERVGMRVCKGIYVEPKELTVGGAEAIRENFIRLAETLYDGGAYVRIATHDQALISHFEAKGWDPYRFEFQVLLGVPVERHMQRLREKGFKTTVYLPYGPEWYAYSMRRLAENPTLIRYVIGNFFKRSKPW